MMTNPLRRRWEIVFVGQESGHVHPVAFMRTWRRSTADRWAARQLERTEWHGMLAVQVRRRD
jgi:hypothetical protein